MNRQFLAVQLFVVSFWSIGLCIAQSKDDSNELPFRAMIKTISWSKSLREMSYDVEYLQHVLELSTTTAASPEKDEYIIVREISDISNGRFFVGTAGGFYLINRATGQFSDSSDGEIIYGDKSSARLVKVDDGYGEVGLACPRSGRDCLEVARPVNIAHLPVSWLVPTSDGPEPVLESLVELLSERKLDVTISHDTVNHFGKIKKVVICRVFHQTRLTLANGDSRPLPIGYTIIVSEDEDDAGYVLSLSEAVLKTNSKTFETQDAILRTGKSVSTNWKRLKREGRADIVVPAEVSQKLFGNESLARNVKFDWKSVEKAPADLLNIDSFRSEVIKLKPRVDKLLSR